MPRNGRIFSLMWRRLGGNRSGSVTKHSDNATESERLRFDDLLDLLGTQIVGPLSDDLRTRNNRRTAHLFDIVTSMGTLWRALAQLRGALLWVAEAPGLESDVSALLHQAAQRIVLGAESILSDVGPRDMDASRFLMEVEYLLYEFAFDPDALDRWRNLPLHERNQQFGFGRLRSRREQREGAPPNHVLSSRNEYRIHSANVHPRPASEIHADEPQPEASQTMLFMDLADLVEHSHRVWLSVCEYIVAIEDTLSSDTVIRDLPDLSDVDEAGRAIAEHNRTMGVPDQAPRFNHVTDDGMNWLPHPECD